MVAASQRATTANMPLMRILELLLTAETVLGGAAAGVVCLVLWLAGIRDRPAK
jgi:hypothetical protein